MPCARAGPGHRAAGHPDALQVRDLRSRNPIQRTPPTPPKLLPTSRQLTAAAVSRPAAASSGLGPTYVRTAARTTRGSNSTSASRSGHTAHAHKLCTNCAQTVSQPTASWTPAGALFTTLRNQTVETTQHPAMVSIIFNCVVMMRRIARRCKTDSTDGVYRSRSQSGCGSAPRSGAALPTNC